MRGENSESGGTYFDENVSSWTYHRGSYDYVFKNVILRIVWNWSNEKPADDAFLLKNVLKILF